MADIEAFGKAAKAGELNDLAEPDAQQMETDLSAFSQQQELGARYCQLNLPFLKLGTKFLSVALEGNSKRSRIVV